MLRFAPFQVAAKFVFKDPDTGRVFSAPNKSLLLKLVRDYRSQNMLDPIEHLSSVVEDYMCSLPDNCGKCEEARITRGLFQYAKGGVNLLKNVFFGEDNMVSQEEADRRAAICLDCPNNIFPDKSEFVEWSDRLALASTDGRRSTYHNELGNCSVCSCCLKAKVFAKDTKVSEQENTELPEFCWSKS